MRCPHAEVIRRYGQRVEELAGMLGEGVGDI